MTEAVNSGEVADESCALDFGISQASYLGPCCTPCSDPHGVYNLLRHTDSGPQKRLGSSLALAPLRARPQIVSSLESRPNCIIQLIFCIFLIRLSLEVLIRTAMSCWSVV